jgi:hypothetical protein
MSKMRDAMLDAAAVAEALSRQDIEAARIVLRHGDPVEIGVVLGGWIGSALQLMGAERATALSAGWRAMAEARDDGFHDYDGPGAPAG